MFDIEIIFLYPWAVNHRELGGFGLLAIVVFAAVFFLSFVYEVAKGGLDWGPLQAHASPHRVVSAERTLNDHHPPGRTRRPAREDEAADGRFDLLPRKVSRASAQLHHRHARGSREVGAGQELVAGHVRPRVLRDRDDGDGRGPLRPRPLRHGGVPRLAAPGRPHDRGRPASQKMAPVLRQVYDQMMEPKWVISMGVCASTGGMFNNYAIVQGVDQVVPVDVYAPGCPPGPETLIHAILTLHELIDNGELTRRRDDRRRRRVERSSSVADRHGRWVTIRRPPPTRTASRSDAPSPTAARLPVTRSRGQLVSTRRARYLDLVTGCTTTATSCASTSPRRLPRRTCDRGRCPTTSTPERFEVVVNLLSTCARRSRVRVRVQVPESDPTSAVAVRHLSRAPKRSSARCSTCSASPSTVIPT